MPKEFFVDEKCRCGHLKSEHVGYTRIIAGTSNRAPNHGACSKCGCNQYTWKNFVFGDGSESIFPMKEKKEESK